jgi:KipI family sensor histidine kinase inhibitor
METCRLTPVGDSGLLIEFEERIDPEVNAGAVALADRVRAWHRRGIRDVVVTFRTVAVWFDPLLIELDALVQDIEALTHERAVPRPETSDVLEIPVRYGGADGPDLADVARFAGCSEETVISLHVETVYRVYMLGFMPGFSYMASVDPRIAMPRRAVPRIRVPAGSVGIAGPQTGIYPREYPGGWQLIGRTTARTVDLDGAEPFLLRPGMRVRFVRVDAVS